MFHFGLNWDRRKSSSQENLPSFFFCKLVQRTTGRGEQENGLGSGKVGEYLGKELEG